MAKNTIKVTNYSNVIEEFDAVAAITPGMLIEPTSADKVQAHSTQGGNATPMFALEDDLQGNGIDDAYSANNKVQCWVPGRGDMVYAILADGENVVIGDYLDSDGDGALRKHVADDSGSIQVKAIVAQAVEALDLSDSSGGESSGALGYDKRILARIV
jgi:hypothetical protein